ncbi:MAG: hypothetical protein HHJ09_16075 [Glaciimonas sp.]|nr:hypothetical protein [Glaciimonas sp.]
MMQDNYKAEKINFSNSINSVKTALGHYPRIPVQHRMNWGRTQQQRRPTEELLDQAKRVHLRQSFTLKFGNDVFDEIDHDAAHYFM